MRPLKRSSTSKVHIGDLFSGAGLFSAAFKDLGAEIDFAIEIDPLAAQSYTTNVGNHVINMSAERVANVSKVDVIVAGPPCQGFSTLGRRDPRDARNRLCLVIPEWARHANASVVVVENVPPFLDSLHWRKMRKALLNQGFEVDTWCLDAMDYGVPQRRRRSFTIASKRGLPNIPDRQCSTTAGDAFKDVRLGDPMHIWPKSSELASRRMAVLPIGGDRRDLVDSAPGLCPPSWHKIGCQATDVWGRINPSMPSNTIRCDFQNPSKGRYIHPTDSRVISLREGARLQQIPDHWKFAGHRTAITRQIGNGVPLGLGRVIAARILELF